MHVLQGYIHPHNYSWNSAEVVACWLKYLHIKNGKIIHATLQKKTISNVEKLRSEIQMIEYGLRHTILFRDIPIREYMELAY